VKEICHRRPPFVIIFSRTPATAAVTVRQAASNGSAHRMQITIYRCEKCRSELFKERESKVFRRADWIWDEPAGWDLGVEEKKKRFMAAILEMREQGGRTSSRLFCTIKLFFFNQLIVLISPVGRQRCRSSSTFVALPFFVEEKI
jgi:hypothetical protein